MSPGPLSFGATIGPFFVPKIASGVDCASVTITTVTRKLSPVSGPLGRLRFDFVGYGSTAFFHSGHFGPGHSVA